MKNIMPILVFTFIIILFISSFPSNTSACSCAELPSVEEEFEQSQAVFSGKVVDIREKRNIKGYITKSVLFEVTDTWKGVKQSQIIITTGQGGGDCGVDFKEGQEYLVYANESTMYGAKAFVSTLCNRTNEWSVLQEDLKILGEGQPPIEDVDLTGKHEGNQLYIWVAIVIAIGILLISIFRRRKQN
jgi:LPXTG-motif cell wall-anchored protein